MNQTGTCPAGHSWAGDPADCPACTADGDSASTFPSDLLDELPPPPTSVRGTTKPTPVMAPPGPRPTVEVPGYDLLGELGRGGMGVVYKARHRALNRPVALKVISAGGLAGPRDLQRFRAEAEAVARLQHPNIVQVFEVGEHDGRPYIALELVEGGTLAQALAANPFPAQPAAELVETLARAVHHAHEQRVIHRDLKPGNILVSRDAEALRSGARTRAQAGALRSEDSASRLTGIVKVTDFGLAKRLEADATQSTTGVAIGTPNYMAPEQAAGLNRLVGPAADIYALGAILYECLTGRPPFQGTSAVETLQQVVAADPVSPARLQPSVPRDLDTICLVCLRKEPRKRYPSALALADDLRRFLDGRPILARRTPMWERAAKWAKRRPALAGLIAVSVLAAGTLAGAAVAYNRRLEQHNRELSGANEQILKERDEARRERGRAETNLDSATDAVEQMLTRVGFSELVAVPHMDRTRVLLMEDALTFLDRLLAAQAEDRRLRVKQVHTLYFAGVVHYQLSQLPAAAERFTAALDIIHELQGENAPPVPVEELRALEAKLLNQRGLVRQQRRDLAAARSDFDAALQIREELAAAGPTAPGHLSHLFHLAIGYSNLAGVLRAEGRANEELIHISRAKSRAEELMARAPMEFRSRLAYASVLNRFGVYQLEHGQPGQSLEALEQAVEIRRGLADEDPAQVEWQDDLTESLVNAGAARQVLGYWRRARELFAQALTIREQLAATHPDVREFVTDLAVIRYRMGELHRIKKEYEPAEGWYSRAITGLESRTDDHSRATLGEIYGVRGLVREQLNRPTEAVDDLTRAVGLTDGRLKARFRALRAVALAKSGPPGPAVAEANAALAAADPSGELLFDAARAFAIAGQQESDRARKETYLRRAVELLTQAERTGFFRTDDGHGQLDKHPDLAPLRGRADFKAVQAKVR